MLIEHGRKHIGYIVTFTHVWKTPDEYTYTKRGPERNKCNQRQNFEKHRCMNTYVHFYNLSHVVSTEEIYD